jgi:hypothetical protein
MLVINNATVWHTLCYPINKNTVCNEIGNGSRVQRFKELVKCSDIPIHCMTIPYNGG